MSAGADIWEYGSEFNWISYQPTPTPVLLPPVTRFYATGTNAMKALFASGILKYETSRVWFPSYFCHDVTESVASSGTLISVYHDLPNTSTPSLPIRDVREGDIIYVVNYFGLREKLDYRPCRAKGAIIVEDHTHAPFSAWANSSDADYCVASLRKTLPIPDGAILWSPKGFTLPPKQAYHPQDRVGSFHKLCGMVLKTMYLNGITCEKPYYYDLLKIGEKTICRRLPSQSSPLLHDFLSRVHLAEWTTEHFIEALSYVGQGVDKSYLHELFTIGDKLIFQDLASSDSAMLEAFLQTYPIGEWDLARQNNHKLFCSLLPTNPRVEYKVLKPVSKDLIPFNITVLFPSQEIRDRVRGGLVQSNIYPVVLWDVSKHDWTSNLADQTGFSRRMLTLACDGRYSESDVTEAVTRFNMVTN